MKRRGHPAFGFAVLATMAGGTGYILKRSLPSFIAGTALGLGFLTAVMSAIVATMMQRPASVSNIRYSSLFASCGTVLLGYHSYRLLHPPRKIFRYPDAALLKSEETDHIFDSNK